jgi:hypothetical protein
MVFRVPVIVFKRSWQRDLNGRDHMDDIAQPHGVRKPTHGLLRIASALSIPSLIFVGFRQQRQPAEAAGLHKGQIKFRWLRVSDPLTLLLNQQT